MATWTMKGEYLKNCNCLASCPCDTEGFPSPASFCEGMAAMHITEGHYDGVPLDGLHWAGVVKWPGALHEGNGAILPLIDERASPEQRDALLQILSGKSGGTFFEIIAAICPTVHEPQFVPFTWEFNQPERRARMSAGKFLFSTSAPLTVPATGAPQRVRVQLPDGFEYKDMDVAHTTTLEASGPITFSHSNTNSSMAHVEHTQAGLMA